MEEPATFHYGVKEKEVFFKYYPADLAPRRRPENTDGRQYDRAKHTILLQHINAMTNRADEYSRAETPGTSVARLLFQLADNVPYQRQ